MKIEIEYVLSQIFVIINYFLLISSYQLKNRTKILLLNFGSLIANAISFFLLGGFSGVGMSIVAIIRNIIFLIDNNNSNNITKKDIAILFFIYTLSVICAIYTYNGFWSLMVVCATMLYTFSIWQKDTKIYKALGVPVGILYILYNIYVKSILGILFESFLMISAIIGFLIEYKKYLDEKNKHKVF